METKIASQRKRQRNFQLRFLIPLFGVLFVYLIFLAGYLVGQGRLSRTGSGVVNTEVGKPGSVDFSRYWEAWNKLREKSVASTDPEKLIDGSIAGMAAALGDPYTTYLPKDENKRFREDISGEFGGIGIEIIQKNDLPTVVAPLDDTPAQKAGIKAGDIILEVDGAKTSDLGFEETINRIRGAKGSSVKLKIARENVSDPIEFTVSRDTIVVKSVKWEKKSSEGKDFLYIKVRQFGDDTDKLFADAAEEAVKSKVDGIIVDLRNNPGGYLETSVNLSSYFVDGGVVVSEQEKDNKKQDYKTTLKATLKNFKLAVLVNKGSASASEIFSGAVQDRGKGKLVGEKTFGKGSVQELSELSDGSAIKVTVAKWFTPNGRQITDKGIDPDISIADDDKTTADEQLDRALQYLVKGE